jgi:hypothetical protein
MKPAKSLGVIALNLLQVDVAPDFWILDVGGQDHESTTSRIAQSMFVHHMIAII